MRALEKRKMFFRPQPLRYFRVDIVFHESNTRDMFYLEPDHRKWKESCLILLRMPLGTQVSVIQ